MKDEIKEILEALKHYDFSLDVPEKVEIMINKALDYITNLQEEVEDLREDNYAYHQLMKMQNKREYRSKFLKEFQEEFGTNTFPDYDEIYKRYDKLKKENERLKEVEKEHKNCTRKHWQQKCAEHCANEMIYKSRIDKAIENIDLVIELIKQQPTGDDTWILNKLNGFKYILNGGDDNE